MKTQEQNNIVSVLSADNTGSGAYSPVESNYQVTEWIWLDVAEASRKARSAWDKGVTDYMATLYFRLTYAIPQLRIKHILTAPEVKEILLNGAKDWQHSSESGSWLVNSEDIAEQLLPKSKRTRLTNNYRALRMQGTALHQAASFIVSKWNEYTR